MKNKALVIMLGLTMLLSAGFLFADKVYAKPCPIEAICITCRHHKMDCCKQCRCKDCKQCHEADKKADSKQDCCKKEMPAE